MTATHLHFSMEEFSRRQMAVRRELAARGLDALLMFRQESMYYLTGYDTFGYVHFQCMVLTADGRTALLTRSPDLRQAGFTSCVDTVVIWTDGPEVNPVQELHDLLADMGLFGCSLGVEYESYGLTAANGRLLDHTLNGFAKLEDASDIVSRLRVVKSDAELAYVRKAGELADAAWQSALETAGPGAFEGDILAAMHGAIFAGGGDDPANEFIIGSGPGAMMCRYYTGRRHLDPQDQLTLEFAGTYRHYHACMMRTLAIGDAPDRQRALMTVARDALLACEEQFRPGRTAGDVFAAHARTMDNAGLSRFRLNACGYSLGTTFAPSWMDWPMLYADNPFELAPGMVFFAHMIIFDDDHGLAATLGRTSIVTEGAAEVISNADLAFVEVG